MVAGSVCCDCRHPFQRNGNTAAGVLFQGVPADRGQVPVLAVSAAGTPSGAARIVHAAIVARAAAMMGGGGKQADNSRARDAMMSFFIVCFGEKNDEKYCCIKHVE